MARPPRSDEEVLRTRLDILVAAERVLSAQGVAGASIDAIAAESGVSPATLYRHFQNRDALLAEVIEHTFRGVVDCVNAPRPRSLDLAERLECIVIDLLQLMMRHKVVMELLIGRKLAAGEDDLRARVRAIHADACHGIEALLEGHVAPGTGQDVHRLAYFFLGLVRTEMLRLIAQGITADDASLPERAEGLVHFFLYGALAPRAPHGAPDVR